MSLEKYNKKREFGKTQEPRGKVESKSQNRFVIQEHHASTLHYDFRLELPEKVGSQEIVLKSWAVPKNLPEDKKTKRLAVATEDHPVSYIDFEGEIPKDQYGAGTVKIWDSGIFDLIKQNEGHIQFVLHGRKLSGEYNLVKTKSMNKNQESWLIFKSK